MSKLTISDARRLGDKLKSDGVIIISIPKLANPSFQSVSYGRDKVRCGIMGRLLELIVDKLASGEIAP